MLIESFDDIYNEYTPTDQVVIPESIKNSISNNFLIDLRNILNDNEVGEPIPTFFGYYAWISGTRRFYDLLRECCAKNDMMYLFHIFENTGWSVGDIMDDRLMELMVERGIIELGEIDVSEWGY